MNIPVCITVRTAIFADYFVEICRRLWGQFVMTGVIAKVLLGNCDISDEIYIVNMIILRIWIRSLEKYQETCRSFEKMEVDREETFKLRMVKSTIRSF